MQMALNHAGVIINSMLKDGEDLVYEAIGNRNIVILCMGIFPYL